MSYCLNPSCPEPTKAGPDATTCQCCGAQLLFKQCYRPLRLLGQGGFGRTVLAVDESQAEKPRCVIKQFFPQQAVERDKASRLFRQEAERLRTLQIHPQVPDLLDYFEESGQQYLVQEFIDGTDLTSALDRGSPYGTQEVIHLLARLLPVLQFMHERKIIHRDIKPANIIRRDRDQKLFLVDLGAAKVATGTALARTGTTIGSAEYTAPEQLRGKAVFASDIYSLGMTCLHLLTGVSPFNLYDADEGRLVWQDYLKVPLDKQLSQILAGMTAVATKQRYVSAKDVLHELRDLSQSRIVAELSENNPPSPIQTFYPDNQRVVKPGLTDHPDFKPPSQSAPVKFQAESKEAPLSIELEDQQTTLATPLFQKKPLFAEESSPLAEIVGNVLAGELPITAMWGRIQREAPDFKGDLAWALGRTALVVLWILGVPALLVIGLQSVSSNEHSIAVEKESASLNEDDWEESSFNRVSLLADYTGSYRNASEAFTSGGTYPQPVTATFPMQEPGRGTIHLSDGLQLASIKTTGYQPVQFELNPQEDTLLISTIYAKPKLQENNILVEIWDLNSAQQRYTFPIQSKFPPILDFSSDGNLLLSQFFPADQPIDINSLPKIQAWDVITGNAVKILPKLQNQILQGTGPISIFGEATLVVFDPVSADGGMSILSQATGEQLFHALRETGRFSNPQFHDSLMALGTAPIGGGRFDEGALVFDINNENHEEASDRLKILSTAFGHSGGTPNATTYGDLKFDSLGRLYIGRDSNYCEFSCLEVYEFNGFQPSYKHIPAQIPPFHELFFDKNPEQVILYIPAHLGAEPQLQVWNIETGSLVKRILLGESYAESVPLGDYKVPPLKISADATKLYTAHAGRVEVWDFQALLK